MNSHWRLALNNSMKLNCQNDKHKSRLFSSIETWIFAIIHILLWSFSSKYVNILDPPSQGSVNQPFIVNKKRGILRGRECPSQLIQTFIQTFNTSSRHTLPHFTKYLWIKLPFKPCQVQVQYFWCLSESEPCNLEDIKLYN